MFFPCPFWWRISLLSNLVFYYSDCLSIIGAGIGYGVLSEALLRDRRVWTRRTRRWLMDCIWDGYSWTGDTTIAAFSPLLCTLSAGRDVSGERRNLSRDTDRLASDWHRAWKRIYFFNLRHAHTAILPGGRARLGDQLRHHLSDDTFTSICRHTPHSFEQQPYFRQGPACHSVKTKRNRSAPPFFGGSPRIRRREREREGVLTGVREKRFFSSLRPRSRFRPADTSSLSCSSLMGGWFPPHFLQQTNPKHALHCTHIRRRTEGELVTPAEEAWNSSLLHDTP